MLNLESRVLTPVHPACLLSTARVRSAVPADRGLRNVLAKWGGLCSLPAWLFIKACPPRAVSSSPRSAHHSSRCQLCPNIYQTSSQAPPVLLPDAPWGVPLAGSPPHCRQTTLGVTCEGPLAQNPLLSGCPAAGVKSLCSRSRSLCKPLCWPGILLC